MGIESINLAHVPCPQNVSKILIKFELMDAGDLLEIFLDPGEAASNVQNSLLAEGHIIEEQGIVNAENPELYRILARKRST